MFWAKQLNDSSEWNKFATALLYSLNIDYGKNMTAHIPRFGDATTSPAADVSAGGLLASPNSEICDTIQFSIDIL